MKTHLVIALCLCATPAWAMEVSMKEPYHLTQLTSELKVVVPQLEGLAADNPRKVFEVRRLSGDFTPAESATITTVIAAHVPTSPLDPGSELDVAIASAITVEDLKAALLGKVKKGKVAGRTP